MGNLDKGGETAIIAAGGSPLDLASDLGGSNRGPAPLRGIAGLNPAMGRVPRTRHIPPFGGAFDTEYIGPWVRQVEVLELALRIVTGRDYNGPCIVPVPSGMCSEPRYWPS